MKTYEQIFSERGHQYNQAMIEYPNTRDQEFQQLINKFHYHPGMTIADTPAGGEYMKKYLPEYCHYIGYEPCDNFKHNTRYSSNPLRLPIDDNCIDITLSLAGLHHIEDKKKIFKEFKRVTKPGGYLGISDVHQDSCVSVFLDQFVDKYSMTGHKGLYLSGETLTELSQTGWNILHAERVKFHWLFKDRAHMALFCQRLFGLSCSPEIVMDEIDKQLGVENLPGNVVGMNWELYTIIASEG